MARFRSFLMRTGAFALVVAFFCNCGSAALAGTTGSLSGVVRDEASGNPVPGAAVSAISPSQSAKTVSDSSGHFVFVALAPDTYTLSVIESGFEPASETGVTVFADQDQTLAIALRKSLKTIATVTSRSSLSPVRPGTISDVYSVGDAATKAATPIGGGGGLNNAYSAIASVPGAYVPNGQSGVNQTVYIRGGNYDQIGFEYDGVPVNRSFDNYPAHSASTLGQQELQIYTGGGGASSNATGLAGFINQVTKSGTYPGYATLSGYAGTPAFYHDVTVEAGGATPDRRFSYYIGLDGNNQAFRYFDQSNGAGLTGIYPYAAGPSADTTFLSFYPAVYPTCNADSTYTNPVASSLTNDPGCFQITSTIYSQAAVVASRDAVMNFHFAIPQKSGVRDDVQVLYTNSAQHLQWYSGPNDAGQALIAGLVAQGDISSPPHWPDYYTYAPGTAFLAPADAPLAAYLYPGSPQNRCANRDGLPNTCPTDANGNYVGAALPNDYRDGRWNDASIFKLQYQKNFGSSGYLRAFGYTFYSDTFRNGASRRGIGSGFSAENYDYEVNAHTRGAQLDFGKQINDKNLFTATANYVTSKTWRYNNSNYLNTSGFPVSNLTNGTQCFAAYDGYGNGGSGPTFQSQPNPQYAAGQSAPCNDPITQGSFGAPTSSDDGGNPENVNCSGGANSPIPAPACAAGAAWNLTYTGQQGPTNSVTPAFTNLSIGDELRPNDKTVISLALKYSLDNFSLTPTNSPGQNFWFAAAQKEYCYNPQTFTPVLVQQGPQNLSTLNPYVAFNCPSDNSSGTPVQTVHPDGLDGHLLFTNNYPLNYSQNYLQPRVGFTYTFNPDTVVRVSAGRYAQEPQNYEVQYDDMKQNLAADLIGFLPYGFTTPFHDAKAQFSDNYDLSYERHFKGTDMSVKLTPYYRYATNQLDENVNIPTLLASPSLNAGTESSKGVEFEFTKGDFARNGLSMLFSYTYLDSKEKWNNYEGIPQNKVDIFNQYIQQYNALTKSGGGSPCYMNSADGTADPACGATSIANPYYAANPQPLLNRNGWYDTGLESPYLSPNVFALVMSYRHARFSVTPAFTLNEGASYGAPTDVPGIDPRTCSANQVALGTATMQNADYTSCSSAATPSGTLYIPNPTTNSFDTFGQYRQPWQFNMGLQLGYDVSPRVSANVTVANLVNRCFGGSSTPWSAQFAPSSNVCGYGANTFYVSNHYNGTSPNDLAGNGVPLNPYFAQPFVPSYGDVNSFNYPIALNVYFQLQVKL
ncbi:MAG: TonB-dependent receptor [Candidatus Eremiobacteraeota bacterium]|nr:TonB-dependent receptor [Candidatus Eremiobacteraeota bacterium]